MRATLQKIHISKVYSLSMQNIFTEQPWLVLFLPVSFSFVTKWKPCVLIITCLDGIPSQIAAFSPPQPFHHKNSNLETSKLPKTLSDQTARLPIIRGVFWWSIRTYWNCLVRGCLLCLSQCLYFKLKLHLLLCVQEIFTAIYNIYLQKRLVQWLRNQSCFLSAAEFLLLLPPVK